MRAAKKATSASRRMASVSLIADILAFRVFRRRKCFHSQRMILSTWNAIILIPQPNSSAKWCSKPKPWWSITSRRYLTKTADSLSSASLRMSSRVGNLSLTRIWLKSLRCIESSRWQTSPRFTVRSIGPMQRINPRVKPTCRRFQRSMIKKRKLKISLPTCIKPLSTSILIKGRRRRMKRRKMKTLSI